MLCTKGRLAFVKDLKPPPAVTYAESGCGSDNDRDFEEDSELTPALRRSSRKRRSIMSSSAKAEPIAPLRRNDLQLGCRLEHRALDSLRLPKRNVRELSEAQIGRVSKSMAELGTATPAIVTSDGELVDGASRIEAARRLGLATYPCYVLPAHYSARDVRLLRTSLNRTQELGGWSFPDLKIELKELRVLGAALDVTGFSLPQIDQICLDEPELAPEQEDLEPLGNQVAVTRSGDLWLVGEHRVMCGDARHAALYQQLCEGDPLARLCLTDVPYNLRIAGLVTSGEHSEFAMASGEMTPEEFAAFNAAWMAQVISLLADGGLLMTFIDWRSVELVLRVGRELDLRLLNVVAWIKTNAGQGSLWRSQHELLPVFKKGDARHCNNVELGRHGRWRSNVWEYPGASSLGSDAREGLKSHPTVKPVALLEDALLDISQAGDVVLEPFLGSGSLLIAAEKTRRVVRAVEIDPAYVDLALRRWMRLTDQTVTLAETGESFEAVQARRLTGAPPDTATFKPRIRVKATRRPEV